MLPSQIEFPKFVADQLLTSDDLNQLFGYLDEQNRLTRTNLIGIGIVCGLHVQWDSSKNELTITKGCGVTSEGYLITVKEKTYTKYTKYLVDTPRVYDKFYKLDGGGNKVAMDVWELKEAATEDIPDLLDSGFLKDKVILLFVELKEENNKNCDPNSCDDKGINVTVSFLPMAVSKADADLLMGTTGAGFGINTYTALPELRMKRWDVPNTNPVSSKAIFDAYFKLLDKNFVEEVAASLTNIYTVFGSIIAGDYSDDPFKNFVSKFEFLYNGTINLNQLIHLQYHYDLFSDLLLAYQEFRKEGTHVLSTCCPDADLFPRHLLLGEAIATVTTGKLPYRHYFIYSPLFDKQNIQAQLKSLFTRLVLLMDKFFLPPVSGGNAKEDSFIRITPSMLWNVPLSHKAIPYYYHVNTGSQPLYVSWDYRKTLLEDAKRNLSYHAGQYSSNDFVVNPLQYDLEPYNFLRVEGIIGKPYVHVLGEIKRQVEKYRLPVNVIALQTGAVDLEKLLSAKQDCNLKDLELAYDIVRREWEAVNGQTIEWLEDNKKEAASLINSGGHSNRFENFIALLHTGNGFMVDDIMSFMVRYNAFITVYEKLESDAEAIRIDLVNLLKPASKADKIFTEDLIDHIDDVTLSIKKGPFRTLREEFKSRITEVYSNLFFSYFTKKHPGIQHKAGVPFGGTFIIVYHGNEKRRLKNNLRNVLTSGPRERAGRAGDFILAGEVMNGNNQPVTGAVVSVHGTTTAATTSAKGRFLLRIDELPAVLEISAAGFISQSASFSDSTDEIEIILQQSEHNIFDEIGDGIVIADFYLPYTCCSDCSPIQYVVTETTPPGENKPPVANAGEDQTVPMIFSAPTTAVLDGKDSKDDDGTIVDYKWTLVSGPSTPTITPDAVSKSKAVASGLEPGDYVFKLTVTDDDGATDDDEVTVKVKRSDEPVTLSISGKQPPFCNDDNSKKRLIATPAGGEFSSAPNGIVVEEDANGFYFVPLNVAADNYQLSYSFPDGRSASLPIGISKSFGIDFTEVTGQRVVVGNGSFFTLSFTVTQIPGAQYSWTYKLANGAVQPGNSTSNKLIVQQVTRDQRIIEISVSAASSPCSASINKSFIINEIIGDN